jgi:hypothetical protein|tara:strand:+ start:136 stop:525 length:390 start_codon:yes stop_codon:yes gene_type:complete
MYNLALFLHITSAFVIAYTTLYGSINWTVKTSSKQFRINLILLSSMSIVSLVTSTWLINIVNYSHSSLWIVISYVLWIVLILINEGLIRRKYIRAKKNGIDKINVSTEYFIMALIVLVLTFLMIYKPNI